MKPSYVPKSQQNGRLNFAQQGENSLKNERQSSLNRQRPATQQEIRDALSLLKSKKKNTFYAQPDEIYSPPLPQLRKANTQVEQPREYPREQPREQPREYPREQPIQVKTQQTYPDPDDIGELEECPEGCGRKFNVNSLQKHIKVCKKVFQQKRKAFDMKEQRIIDDQHAKLLQEKELQEKLELKKQQQIKNKPQVDNRPLNAAKKPKWKAQSEAFRAILKQNKGEEMTQEQKFAIQEAEDIGRIQCDHCGRKFNDSVAKKHIPLCAEKAKIKAVQKRPTKK
ncbi:Zinc finger C2HC domain-containing protein 1A [Paramecium bursaria]